VAMRLRRARDSSLISDKIHECAEFEDFRLNRLRTVTNVSYVQPQGRLERGFDVTLLFAEGLTGSTLANMRRLMRLAHRKEWLLFTDRYGATHDVLIPEPPEKEYVRGVTSVYYVSVLLLKRGWE
jgi:hypothetical protein